MFFQLTNSRRIGMSVGGIPVSEMKALMDIRGIDGPQERIDIVNLLTAMDSVWLNWLNKSSQSGESDSSKSDS